MPDEVYLLVNKMRIDNIPAYSVEADIYTPADGFNIEIRLPERPIPDGALCELYVNGKLEMTGVCDRAVRRHSKDGATLMLEGRDLAGLLVDSYCEEFITVRNMTLKDLAERLLRNVPFINKKAILYQDDIRGNLKKKKGKGGGGKGKALSLFASAAGGTAHTFAQIQPGQTIIDVLKVYCQSRGLMFWVMPDGTFVFGKPKDGGQPLYNLTMRDSDGSENNVIEAVEDKNLSKRYSKITVMGQQQGTNAMGLFSSSTGTTAGWNTQAAVYDSTFPFYKPYVATDNNDSRSPKLHGRMLLEKMRYEGYQLIYTVGKHSQNGLNYTINEMAHIVHERFGIEGDFLIYGRAFRRTKEDGLHTVLRLGYPGLVVQ